MNFAKLRSQTSVFVLAGSFCLFFLPLGSHALWDSDEGRYAEIAREMLFFKDWISPHLNHVLYFEKPPLMYWLTAMSLAVFGQNEFAARFWCAMFGWLTVWLTLRAGRAWRSERTGVLAATILASSLLFFGLTQYLILDMTLTFWTTLMLLAASHLLKERRPDRLAPHAILFGIAAAGGTLTKGPVAIVLPVLTLGVTAWFTGHSRTLWKMDWKKPLLIGAAIAAPWFIAVSLQHPFFLPFFFIHEHLSRFLTDVHHRTAPLYFFVPVLLGGFLPWSLFAPAALVKWFRDFRARAPKDPAGALWLTWSVVVFLFFSLSHSKLVAYLLPIFPALALLTAAAFDEALDQKTMPGWIGKGIAFFIAVLIGILIFLKLPSTPMKDPTWMVIEAVKASSGFFCLAVGLSVFILVGVWGMRRTMTAFWGIVGAQVLFLLGLITLTPALGPYLSTRALARRFNASAGPAEAVVSYGISYENVLQTFVFYTGRRIAVYGDAGELSLGRDHSPDAADWFAGEPTALEATTRLAPGSWILADDERWEDLRKRYPAMYRAVEHSGKLFLIQKTT
jgi:4-amino-4-deoxy-L-arabinose transferase-like glycosyltransferase